jgi:PAS domain S-box-containing protein
VLFMILLLSIAITRSIISPVTRLKLQAERLIAGDFSARSHLQTNDEIGGLARVIDHMAETLGIRTHELQEAKAKDEAILSSIGDAVFAVDTNSNLILLNPVAEAMAGIQKEDALGKHYSTYLRFVNEDTDVEDSSFVRTALSGRKTNMENHTALVAKDGRKIAVSDRSER